jgi:hypothetical protein
MKKTVTMIDPPSGWKYGFPKIFPEEATGRNLEWLIENGYPESEIESYGKHFYCRYWNEEVVEDKKDVKCKTT